jgi:hypothetical protein
MTTFQIRFTDRRFDGMNVSPAEKADLICTMIEEGVAFLDDGYVASLEVSQIDEHVLQGAEIAADASSLSNTEMAAHRARCTPARLKARRRQSPGLSCHQLVDRSDRHRQPADAADLDEAGPTARPSL